MSTLDSRLKILSFAGSLRAGSFNHLLLQHIARQVSSVDTLSFELKRLRSYEIPLYDGDLEQASGVPQGAARLAQEIHQSNGLVITCPEYNGGISGVLKNTVDWLSRVSPQPLKSKPVLLLGASPGALGAVRGLWHTRVPFEALGAHVYPDMMGVGGAAGVLSAQGELIDSKSAARLDSLMTAFIAFAAQLSTARE